MLFTVMTGSNIIIILISIVGLIFNKLVNDYLKTFFKTKRPKNTPETRDYSFPSLHSQLSSYLLAFFFMQNALTLIVTLPVYLIVVYQRLRGKHHYVNDVVVGTLLGFGTGFFLGVL
jgi:membrane-associated phospholipid phosphatase